MAPRNPDDMHPAPLPQAPSQTRLMVVSADAAPGADAPPGADGEGGQPFDLSSLLRAFSRRWFLATAAGLLLMAAAAAGMRYAWPMKYTVSTLLHLSFVPPSIIGSSGGNVVEFSAYQKEQQNLIKSQAVLLAAVQELQGKPVSFLAREADPVDWLQKELKTDFVLSPETLRVSVATGQPHEAKVLLEAVAAAYLREVRAREHEAKQKRLDQLETFRKQYAAELDRRRARQEELLKMAGSKDPRVFAAKYSHFIKELDETRKRRRESEMERDSLKLQLEDPGSREPQRVAESTVEEAIRNDPLYQKLAELEGRDEEFIRVQSKKLVRGKDDAGLRDVREELEDFRAKRRSLHDKLHDQIFAELTEKANRSRQVAAEQMRDRLSYLNKCIFLFAANEKQLEAQTEALNANQVNLESSRQADGPLEKVADQFSVEMQMLSLEMKAESRVSKGEGPTVDWAAAAGKRLKVVGAAGLAGLFLGMGLVTWAEFRNGRVDGVKGVVRGLRLPVVGQIPRLPPGGRAEHLADNSRAAKASQMVEALDVTRTRLLHHARESDSPRMVLVTSAVAGEGKTTLACHLAASLARGGLRTLLLDADMRRPTAHHLFELPLKPGFAELLQGQATADEVLRPTAFPDLWLLPAGRWDAAVARALAQPRLREVLDDLRGRFDFVLLDSPPLLPVADTLLLGAKVDGVLVSVLQGVSQVRAVQQAAERLDAVGARLIGVVLNAAQLPKYGYFYGQQRS